MSDCMKLINANCLSQGGFIMKIVKSRSLTNIKTKNDYKKMFELIPKGTELFLPYHLALEVAQAIRCGAEVPDCSTPRYVERVLHNAFQKGRFPWKVYIELPHFQ